jgi:hypothetical protein
MRRLMAGSPAESRQRAVPANFWRFVLRFEGFVDRSTGR